MKVRVRVCHLPFFLSDSRQTGTSNFTRSEGIQNNSISDKERRNETTPKTLSTPINEITSPRGVRKFSELRRSTTCGVSGGGDRKFILESIAARMKKLETLPKESFSSLRNCVKAGGSVADGGVARRRSADEYEIWDPNNAEDDSDGSEYYIIY